MALPDRIYGQASPKSLGGRSLFSDGPPARPSNVISYSSHPTVTQAAIQKLQTAGFEILQVTPVAINFIASPAAIEKATRTKLVQVEKPRRNGAGTTTFIDSPDTERLGHVSTKGTPLEDLIEGIAIEVPRDLLAASSIPPAVGYPHISIPTQLADAANATILHRLGVTGAGVKVAMVDSGWYAHPYFAAQGYTVAPVTLAPGAINALRDESGHGTGESANIMAIAPGCQLLPVKANFTNTVAAFNTAVLLEPDIITCSWGTDTPDFPSAADLVLSASVAAAVARGIIVIFSAGNGHAGYPGQHPDVISVGGVLMHEDGSLEASNYSSAFTSRIFPGRQVPDICGLVGSRPKAIYIMLPVEPGDNIDVNNSGEAFPLGDETAPDDGWAAFSGTSAAAPQIAGVAALIKQIVPAITSASVKEVLTDTARDVITGMCSPVTGHHQGLPAAPGPDGATGPGLFDAAGAVYAAYTRFVSGALDVATVADDARLATAAYYQGVADAARAGAASTDEEGIASYLRDVAQISDALAHVYWTSATT